MNQRKLQTKVCNAYPTNSYVFLAVVGSDSMLTTALAMSPTCICVCVWVCVCVHVCVWVCVWTTCNHKRP